MIAIFLIKFPIHHIPYIRNWIRLQTSIHHQFSLHAKRSDDDFLIWICLQMHAHMNFLVSVTCDYYSCSCYLPHAYYLTHRTSGDLGVHVYVCWGCIPAGTKTHTQDLGGLGGTLHVYVWGECMPTGTKTHTQDLGGLGGTLHMCVGGGTCIA